ncbi:PIN domain-containing protein [Haladaptatus sp. YSMS36]|uniref:PIN domain-containing protein n=1 Tax=Haladaptatus sp. YSMS36 TaxID=3033384 RepID=UPI0023E8B3E3|nr:PIN domain-containing protein [Haladaptatus sp. YSMS36]
MTLYDSSVLIDYLDGKDEAIEYVEAHLDDRAITPPLVMFEVYQGEIFKAGPAEFDALENALKWVTVVEETASLARAAAELQNDLNQRGQALAARDAFIAGTAKGLDERLVVADADFDVAGITDILDIDFI